MLKLDANAYRGEGLSIRRWQTHGDIRGKGAWRRRQQWKTTSPLSPREPQLVSGGLPGSTAPTLRTAITLHPQNKCCFNRSCSSDPVISPPYKRQVAAFQCKLSTMTPPPLYASLKQAGGSSPAAFPGHSPPPPGAEVRRFEAVRSCFHSSGHNTEGLCLLWGQYKGPSPGADTTVTHQQGTV